MVEDIILQHSKRGMDILRQSMPSDFCRRAAKAVYAWDRGCVFITTGFFVGGTAETDGPPGLMVTAEVLKQMGFQLVILTDLYCEGMFDSLPDVQVLYVPIQAEENYYSHLLAKYQPTGMISIERCGRNAEGDYANMRGISIAEKTANIDTLFMRAKEANIPTVGVGDGGNEIGMGVLRSEIESRLSLKPCVVPVDHLVIATVSNWGAYGLAACLCTLDQKVKMPLLSRLKQYLEDIVNLGAVDGVSGQPVVSVDGFAPEYEYRIYQSVCAL